MLTLTLKDESTFSCDEGSIIDQLTIRKPTEEEAEGVVAKATIDNFSKCSLDDREYVDRIPVDTKIVKDNEANNFKVIITTREKTIEEYIIEQGQQILELQEAFAEIIG